MLNENGEENNGCSVPSSGVTLTQVSDEDWFLRRKEIIKILCYAGALRWEACEEQNRDVHWNGEVRDETHDFHPVSDAARALSFIPLTNVGYILEFD